MSIFRNLRILLFFLAIAFIILATFVLTIGQKLPIEFRYDDMQNYFYDTVFAFLPFAFLFTLFGTLKKKYSNFKNWMIGIITMVAAILCFFIIIQIMFSIGFGTWVDETILFKKKENINVTINQQIYDVGAFGYGEHRIVELKPILKYFQLVSQIDTTKIDKEKWIFVNASSNIFYR